MPPTHTDTSYRLFPLNPGVASMRISMIVLLCNLLTTWLYKAFTDPTIINKFISPLVPFPEVNLALNRTIHSLTAIVAGYAYYRFIDHLFQYSVRKGPVNEYFDLTNIMTDLVLSAWIGEGNLAASAIPFVLILIVWSEVMSREGVPLLAFFFAVFCVLCLSIYTGYFGVFLYAALLYTQLGLVDTIEDDSTLPPNSNLVAAYMPAFVIFGFKFYLWVVQYFTGSIGV